MGWFSKVVNAVKGAAGAVADTASDAADAVGDAIGDAADAVGDAVGDAAGAVADTASGAASAAWDLGGDALNRLGDAAGKAYDTVTDVGYQLLDPATSLRNAGEIGSRIVETTGDIASKAIGETLGASILPDAIEDLGDELADAIDESTDLTGDAIVGLSDAAASVADETQRKTGDVILSAADEAGKAWEGTKDVAGDAWGGIKDAAGSVADGVGDAAGAVGDAASSVGRAVADGAEAVSSGIRDVAGDAFDAVSGMVDRDEEWEEQARLRETADEVAQERVENQAKILADMARDRIEGDSGATPDVGRQAGSAVDPTPGGGAGEFGMRQETRAWAGDATSKASTDPAVAQPGADSDTGGMALEGFDVVPGSRVPAGGHTDGRPGGATAQPVTPPASRMPDPEQTPDVDVPGFGGERSGGGRPGGGAEGSATDDADVGARAEVVTEHDAGEMRGDGLPGAGSRPASSDDAPRAVPHDEPRGLDVAADARAGRIPVGRSEGGDGDGQDDLAEGLLGRTAAVTDEPVETDHLELPDIDVRPHTNPMGLPDGDDVPTILPVDEADELLADDAVGEDSDPDDDGLDF